jgi:hypothetical protein
MILEVMEIFKTNHMLNMSSGRVYFQELPNKKQSSNSNESAQVTRGFDVVLIRIESEIFLSSQKPGNVPSKLWIADFRASFHVACNY